MIWIVSTIICYTFGKNIEETHRSRESCHATLLTILL